MKCKMKMRDDYFYFNVVPGRFNCSYYYSELQECCVSNMLLRLDNNYKEFCRRMKLEYENV
jgi:hypothetical protein